jgi:hypothetical protein
MNYTETDYLIRSWIPIEKLDWSMLSANPKAIYLLEKNPDKIDWSELSRNKNAIHLLEKNLDKIDWSKLSENPKAIHLLELNQDKIIWSSLSKNKNAIHLLELEQNKIDWQKLVYNKNAGHLFAADLRYVNKYTISLTRSVFKVLEAYPWMKDVISWDFLSANPDSRTLELFEQNPKNKIHIHNLSCNHGLWAIPILEKNLDKVNWSNLSRNKNAIHILEQNPTKIDWKGLSQNPAIFAYQYQKMKERCSIFKEELIATVFHPRNYHKFADWGYEEFID